VTGKVVRYLQDGGSDVQMGEPFVEVEAMKMIIPIKATESGKITHALSPGSVITAGDLLASLELKDPSKVKKIGTFDGELDIANVALEVESDPIKTILTGFQGDPNACVATAFAKTKDVESAAALATSILSEFLRVENVFAGKLLDDVVRELTKANPNDLDLLSCVKWKRLLIALVPYPKVSWEF
jgi:acetyl-CoA carboxylase / biotin carboxylase 1